jgi:hypothetical protein
MSNIIQLAPYAYMAKRSGSNDLYDLLLLVPVGSTGDTNLSNVTAVKPGGTRITIDYSTTGSAANVPYRFKHFVIDSEGKYEDIKIQGDNNSDRTLLIAFDDADTEPATVVSDMQTCAPYIFVKKEVSGTTKFVHPSCVVLFDGTLGIQSESITFAAHSCNLDFTLGHSSITTNPPAFLINQNLNAVLTPSVEYTFEVDIAGNSNYNKPPRKHKVKVTVAS